MERGIGENERRGRGAASRESLRHAGGEIATRAGTTEMEVYVVGPGRQQITACPVIRREEVIRGNRERDPSQREVIVDGIHRHAAHRQAQADPVPFGHVVLPPPPTRRHEPRRLPRPTVLKSDGRSEP